MVEDGRVKMERAINKRNWWIVLVVGGILAIAVILIQQKWLPDYELAAFLIAMVITPKDASGSSLYGVISMGLGAAIIGIILKHPIAKIAMYAIAIITLLVGILMLPIVLIWKIILIVVELIMIGYLIWQNNRQLTKK
jgi:hypothetical protein